MKANLNLNLYYHKKNGSALFCKIKKFVLQNNANPFDF